MKKIVLIVLFSLSLMCYGAYAENASVTVHQSTLNLFLAAVGPVTGVGDYNVAGMKGKYTWTVQNARIEIDKDVARFRGDATINIAGMKYENLAEGAVEVRYEKETNKIFVKVQEAKIEIALKVFGKKTKITDIDVAQYYRPEFQFTGPQPIQSSIELKMPDGTVKVVNISADPHMTLEKEKIVVTSQLTFMAAK